MSAAELLDVNALVPDGIEPVEALRCWRFDGTTLTSVTGVEVWTPGQPLGAKCRGTEGAQYAWDVVRGGWTREKATAEMKWINGHAQFSMSVTSGYYNRPPFAPSLPTAELPDGYGWELITVKHDAPDEGCSCGIYATTDEEQITAYGVPVYGKVKLWGKIVPGERGVRAQYAYPSEFRVHSSLADNPALKAFGVPIVADNTLRLGASRLAPASQFLFTPMAQRTGMPYTLRCAVAVNLAACLLNLTMIGWHLL